MYITKNRLRRALAAVTLITSAGLALAAGGAVRADTDGTPDTGARHVAADAHTAETPPGPARETAVSPVEKRVTVVDRYEVVAGDSFWAIAEHQLPENASAADLTKLAKALIERNAPRLGYDDPAMIRPGDVVEVVATPQSDAPAALVPDRAAAPAAHEVVAGDSYWAIAESVLGDAAAPAEVQAKTEELIALNSARLRYDDPRMIQPGDVVYLEAAEPRTSGAVREDARVLVAAAEQMESATVPTSKPRPTSSGIVREDARVLVAAAQQMLSATPTSKPVRTPMSPPLSELAILATSARDTTAAATSAALPANVTY